jgi:hypothetical protein
MDIPDLRNKPSIDGLRLIHVKIPATDHEFIRQTSFRQKATNAQVLCWAIELLRRYVQAGGD